MDEQLAIIAEFRNLIETHLQEFLNASQQLGEPIFGLANSVRRAFRFQLSFIMEGLYMERPDDVTFRGMIDLMSKEINDINQFRDQNRNIEQVYNHISTISESIMALSWIAVPNNAPIQYIREMRDAGQYYGNRVLSQYRGNPQHQEWIKKWNNVISALEEYVRAFHRTGFDWNHAARLRDHGRPRAVGDADVGLSQGPPPPPPPPPAMDLLPQGGDTRSDTRQNLLRDLNQGVDIVRMLKPVSKGQPSQSQKSVPSTSGGNAPRKPVAERTYPPKLVLDGRKWRVEHYKDRFDLVIDSAEMSHGIGMFNCQNSGLEVRNKVNSVTIDNCKRASVVLRDIIACVELIRCQHAKIQCNGHVPLISIDNCESIEVYLSDMSSDVEIISSKSSSLNVSVMAPDGDYVEMAVPEQIKTVVVDGRLVSTVVEKI